MKKFLKPIVALPALLIAVMVHAQTGHTKVPKPDTVITTKPMTEIIMDDQLHRGYDEMSAEEIENPQCGTLYQDMVPGQNVRYVWAEGPCKNGQLNGTWKQYFIQRPWVMISCEYVNGARNGNYFRYDQRGKVVESRVYKNDSLDGEWKRIDENGYVTVEHYKNGKLDGLSELSDETIHYKNGLKDGKYIHWSDKLAKKKDSELFYDKGDIVRGTFFFENGIDTLATVQAVAPGEWRYYRYEYTEKKDDRFCGKKSRFGGFVHLQTDTADYHLDQDDLAGIDWGEPSRYFRMDSLWMHPHWRNDSTCWLYRENQLVQRESWHRNDSGLVCLRKEFYPMYWSHNRSDYNMRVYANAGPRMADYRVNGKLIRHDEFYPQTRVSKKTVLSCRAQYDMRGQATLVTRFFTDGSDSARWVSNDQSGEWECRWTSADSSFYGTRHYTKDSLRTWQWITKDRRLGQTTVDIYANGKLSSHQVLKANRAIVESGSYVDGKKNGVWTETEADGSISEGKYVDGLREGEWTTWYLYGQKKKSFGTYTAGVKTGKWKQWDQDGKKIRK